jgi:hypothetical protein
MDNPEELATQGKDKQSKQYNTENKNKIATRTAPGPREGQTVPASYKTPTMLLIYMIWSICVGHHYTQTQKT